MRTPDGTQQRARKHTLVCRSCGSDFTAHRSTAVYCSHRCWCAVNRPTRRTQRRYPQLNNLVWLADQLASHTQSEIAGELGCDAETVRRAVKRHGIQLQPRATPVTYRKAHKLLDEARTGRCSRPGCVRKGVTEMALIRGRGYLSDPAGQHAGVLFSDKRDDYIELCVSCHRRYDMTPEHRAAISAGLRAAWATHPRPRQETV